VGDRGYLHPFWDGRRFENGVGEDVRTLVELKMNRLSYYIRSLPHWCTLLNNPDTLGDWRTLARAQGFLPHDSDDEDMIALRLAPVLTEYQISWVLDELSYYARRRGSNDCQVRVTGYCSIRSLPPPRRPLRCGALKSLFKPDYSPILPSGGRSGCRNRVS